MIVMFQNVRIKNEPPFSPLFQSRNRIHNICGKISLNDREIIGRFVFNGICVEIGTKATQTLLI